MSEQENKPYCIVPWVSITQTANNRVKPCCLSNRRIGERGINLKDAWHHSDMIELRKEMILGKPIWGCQACTLKEKHLGETRAQWFHKKIGSGDIEIWNEKPPMDLLHMDLNFGNKCNLKCRMCGSWGSNQWFKEDQYLQKLNPDFERTIESSDKIIIHNSDNFLYLKDSFTKLQRIDFKGGEPFLQEGMYEFLQHLIDWNYAKNITIGYTTNGTIYDKRIEKLWPQFKNIIVNLSLDGTGKYYQYIRGGKHHTLETAMENMRKFNIFENFHGNYAITVQIYNLFNLIEIFDLISNTNFIRVSKEHEFDMLVTEPKYLNINILPRKIKNDAIDLFVQHGDPIFNPIIESLQREVNDEKQLKLFVQFTNELDKLRNTNLLDVEPRFAELFDER